MNVATILAARINSASSPENTAWISGAQTDNRPELREPLHATINVHVHGANIHSSAKAADNAFIAFHSPSTVL